MIYAEVNLGAFGLLKALFLVEVKAQIDAWELPISQDVDQQITEGYEVISPACHLEFELVKTGENHVSSEHVNLCLLDVLPGVFIDVPGGESVVD